MKEIVQRIEARKILRSSSLGKAIRKKSTNISEKLGLDNQPNPYAAVEQQFLDVKKPNTMK